MVKSLSLSMAMIASVLASDAALAQGRDRVQVGQLSCDISGGVGLVVGSQRALNCTFTPAAGGPWSCMPGL